MYEMVKGNVKVFIQESSILSFIMVVKDQWHI